MTELKYRYTLDPEAENDTAASIARLALLGGRRVLDIGSGPAWVSRYLAGEHRRKVTCLDNDIDALKSLQGTELTAIEADLEQADWDAALSGQQFDVVILADVLEHLRQPGLILERLLSASLLRSDGLLVVSVPNASHQSVVSELLLGDFRYTETGILDETHVRWFTLDSLTRLLERCGFVVDRVERTRRKLEHTPSGERALAVPDEVRRRLPELNDESLTYQFVVLARPDTAARRMASDRDAFDAERQAWHLERGDLLRQHRVLQHEVDRLTGLLRAEREAASAETAAGAAELEVLTDRVQHLHARLAASAEQMQAMGGKIESLRRRVARWKTTAEARGKKLEFYRASRGMRIAERVVRRVRRIRRWR
ncbi:MAG TPA: class I SAM-dependent methyltransferase [Aeromicrobium sp.]|nr:class I SAM-dependent methyltransferase [Aeromicrobium sp.]